MHERDRYTQADRQTDRHPPHDDIGRACIASCGKKLAEKVFFVVDKAYCVVLRWADVTAAAAEGDQRFRGYE